MSKFAGFKDIEYAAAGSTPNISLGRIKEDSTHTAEPATENDAMGLEVFAGEDDTYTVNCYDITKYAGLRAIAISDTNFVDLKFTYLDSTTETKLKFSVIVSKPTSFATGARNFFTARFKRFVIN